MEWKMLKIVLLTFGNWQINCELINLRWVRRLIQIDSRVLTVDQHRNCRIVSYIAGEASTLNNSPISTSFTCLVTCNAKAEIIKKKLLDFLLLYNYIHVFCFKEWKSWIIFILVGWVNTGIEYFIEYIKYITFPLPRS